MSDLDDYSPCMKVSIVHLPSRISLCFVCYLLATVPSVWLLELQRIGLFEATSNATNTTTATINFAGGVSTFRSQVHSSTTDVYQL